MLVAIVRIAPPKALEDIGEFIMDLKHTAFVFISCIAPVMANIMPMEHEYGVMKAALNVYSSQLAHRLANDGIRSNVVAPGPIDFEGGFWDQLLLG